MNNKEYISELSQRSGHSMEETTRLLASVFADITQNLQIGKSVTIQGFGCFEVRKKAERISINPASKKRMLVPPKLTVTYRPSTSIKDKFKEIK
ncbi:DNA-binding protein HU [termite gut metagenome]|uniref:DNA-binding protein HU n=1 Tax=termite gut metagenome TaxID=433724 RepID=A0A5J4SCW5_9ZZZZ